MDDAIWLAWVEKGGARDRRAARKYRFLAAVAFGLIAIAAGYFFAFGSIARPQWLL